MEFIKVGDGFKPGELVDLSKNIDREHIVITTEDEGSIRNFIKKIKGSDHYEYSQLPKYVFDSLGFMDCSSDIHEFTYNSYKRILDPYEALQQQWAYRDLYKFVMDSYFKFCPLSPYTYYNKTNVFIKFDNGIYCKSEDFPYYETALRLKFWLKRTYDIDICYLSTKIMENLYRYCQEEELKSDTHMFMLKKYINKFFQYPRSGLPIFMEHLIAHYDNLLVILVLKLFRPMNGNSILVFYHDDKMIKETQKLEDYEYLLDKMKGENTNGKIKKSKNKRKGRKAKKEKSRETKEVNHYDIRTAYNFRE